MSGESRVFVVQEPPRGVDITAATKFGKLIDPLLPADRQIVLGVSAVLARLRRQLEGFNDDDYLLALGDPVAIVLTCHVAAEKNRGRYKVLKWDRRSHFYYPVEVNLYPNKKGDEDVEPARPF